jgi:pyruvate/2-oxoglutarate dehydrogenase complex dihydrolipoamide dehydrogenase (E3) component
MDSLHAQYDTGQSGERIAKGGEHSTIDILVIGAGPAGVLAAHVIVHEHACAALFVTAHTIETEGGFLLQAKQIIICTGIVSRRLDAVVLS